MTTYVPIEKIAAWLITALVLVLLISACSDEPVPDQVTGSVSTKSGDGGSAAGSGIDSKNPVVTADWNPSTRDKELLKENAFVETTEILTLESYPPQFVLIIQGTLPTPCNKLRVWIAEPDEENGIYVEVYSVIEPGKMCIQVLEEFEENIPLGTPPKGYYSVFVNGEEIGEIGYE